MTTTVWGTIRGMAGRANPAFAVGTVAVPLVAFAVGTVAVPLVAFAVGTVAVPLVAFAVGATVGTTEIHTYVHVMAGVLWTGIDVFMALVIGPVLGGLSVNERASWFETFTPKMAFLMPTLATVTIFGGITLADRIGVFPNSGPWVGLFVFVEFAAATLLLGWVFDAFRDRRWLAFFALAVVGNGTYLATEVAGAGMQLPGTRPIIVLILAVMVVLTVLGFGFLMPNEVLVYLEMMSDEPDRERIGRLGLRNAKLSGVQGTFQLAIIVLMVYLRWGGL